ncbi:MAG: hypothetical protein Q8Q08_00420, partial [Candidatus Omnitrophota bacterium]|nr:hypothetical protein [Candidatus Omnitrophota bacterium]
QCSGKSSSQSEAVQLCELSASQPKERKGKKRRSSGGGSSGGMRLILLTNAGCKPCSAAKSYLQDRIDRGEVEVLDIQKSDFAADLVAKHKIVSVPKLMLVDSEGNPFSEIQVTDNAQMI